LGFSILGQLMDGSFGEQSDQAIEGCS